MTPTRRIRAALLGLCLATSTSACFTTMAWGGDPFDDDDGPRASRRYGDDDGGPSIWASLALTPFTLVLDLVTAPVQAFFLFDDDDDDRYGSGRSRAETGSPNTPGTTLRSH